MNDGATELSQLQQTESAVAKQAYEPPTLTVLGNVVTLTRGASGSRSDGFSSQVGGGGPPTP